MPEPLLFDAWTPLAFKRALGDLRRGGRSWTAPTWVGHEARRLQAYTLLRAYVDNAAREFLADLDEERTEQHREYGDAYLLVASAVAAVLGESQSIYTEGADDEADLEEGEPTPALDLQDWLRDWARRERFTMKLVEAERNAVGLGDAVYSLGWSDVKGRPRLRVWDPGFYFPVLDDGNEDEYPSTVHVAWEYEDPDDASKLLLRRITWELRPITPSWDDDRGEWETVDGDRWVDGRLARRYPWAPDEDAFTTCYLTDATWRINRGGPVSIYDLDASEATYAVDGAGQVRDRDLLIDFVPVVHVPNTVALADHFGQSVLARVLQILDDLANADTDLQAASATTGTPPLALEGATLGGDPDDRPRYQPGEIIETGDGRLVPVDTSRSLDALVKYVTQLLARLSTNARLPESVLGRVKPSEVPSGIALLLSFGPLTAMVNEMRLVREEKYGLLFRFAWRLAVAGRAPDAEVPPEWLESGLDFGPFLPEDRASTVAEVERLLNADAISVETGVRLLVQAGLPIDDAVAEVERIQARDFEGANRLLDATGDDATVREYLGLEPLAPPRPEPPPLDLPPTDEE